MTENENQEMTELEKVCSTLQELKSETKVAAWVFQMEKKFYHVAAYDGGRFGGGYTTSIWESNKRGKRSTQHPIYTLRGSMDPERCIEEFMNSMQQSS